MNAMERLNEKPLEVLVALTLMCVGIGMSFLAGANWLQAVGGAVAAIGGAFLSHVAGDVNVRQKAVEQLKPDLQSTSRHLADTVTKINRNIQACQAGSLDPETAIDRVSQLTSGLYGTVNDLHILVGSPPDFQMLVETVITCEEMASRLERLTDPAHHGDGAKQEELDQLRSQLASARMQLASAKKEFGGVEVAKVETKIRCPTCNNEAVVKLGKSAGDSAMHTCAGCTQRFHIHRDANGAAYTRPWGGTGTQHVEVECPQCHGSVPLNFNPDREYEERFCMRCATLLRISPDGQVVKIRETVPAKVEIVRYHGYKAVLRCPQCGSEQTAIWKEDGTSRAICRRCVALLEAETGKAEQSPAPYGSPATGSLSGEA